MSAPLQSYLRTYRKRSGFSQDELAFLLGNQSGTKVSRYERLARQPSLRTVFAYEVIFGAPVRNLFAGFYRKVEKTTVARGRLLAKKLNTAKPDRFTAHKLTILKALSASAAARSAERR